MVIKVHRVVTREYKKKMGRIKSTKKKKERERKEANRHSQPGNLLSYGTQLQRKLLSLRLLMTAVGRERLIAA